MPTTHDYCGLRVQCFWQANGLDGSLLSEVSPPTRRQGTASLEILTSKPHSGFTTPDINPDFFCTSAVTAPIPLLLIPAITTTDIYTTLPGVKSIQHDQVTVLWEETDLSVLPRQVAGQYASMMGLTGVPALTVDIAATNPPTTSADTPSPSPSIGPSSTPPLPPAITSTSSSSISTSTDDAASSPAASLMPDPENSTSPQLSTNSNTVTASFTSAPSVTTIRPPSQSWFPVSTRTSTGVSPAGTTSNTRTSTTVRPSQSTTTNWPPSTPVNTSSSLWPQTRRLRDLCLIWTSLFAAMYFT